jgi:hypothetical protein
MVRMGHDSERATLIYQHEARGADQRITGAIHAHVQVRIDVLAWAFSVERVTGIEPALSAWEVTAVGARYLLGR